MDILNKKKLLQRNERSFEIQIPLIKPTDTSYTIVNFATSFQRNETQHNSDDNDTYSSDDSSGSCSQKDEILELVPNELLAKGIGYDVKDQFIDDSELVIPLPKRDMQETFYGGYFLNVGQVRSKHEKRPETPKKLKDKPAGKKAADKKAEKNEPQKPARMTGMPPTQRRMVGQPPNKRLKMNAGLEFISSDTDDDAEKLPSPKANDASTESAKTPEASNVQKLVSKSAEKALAKKSPKKVKSPKKMVSKKLESKSPVKQDQFKKPRQKRKPKVVVDAPSTDNQPSTSSLSINQPTTPVAAKNQPEKASLEKPSTSTPTKPSQPNVSDFMSKIQSLKNNEEFLAFLKQSPENMMLFMKLQETSSSPPKLTVQKAKSPRPSTSSDTDKLPSNAPTLTNQVNRLPSPSKQTSNVSPNVVPSVQVPSTSTNNTEQPKKKRPYNKRKPVDSSNLSSNIDQPVQVPSTSTTNTDQPKQKRPYNKKKPVDSSTLPSTLSAQSSNVSLNVSSNVVPSVQTASSSTTNTDQPKQKRPYNKKKPTDNSNLVANLPTQPIQSTTIVPSVQAPSTSVTNATMTPNGVEQPKQKRPYNKKPVDNPNNVQSLPNAPLLTSQSTNPSSAVPPVQTPSSISNVAATPSSSVEPKKKRQYTKKQVPNEVSKQATNSPAISNAQKELIMKSLTKTPDGNFLFMGGRVDASIAKKMLAQLNDASSPQVPKQSVNNVSSSSSTPKSSAIEVKTPAVSQQKPPLPRIIQPALNNTSLPVISSNTSSPYNISVPSKLTPAQKTQNGAPSDTPKAKKPRKQNEAPAINKFVDLNLMPNFLPNTSQHNNNIQAFNAAMLSSFMAADQMKNQSTPPVKKAEVPPQKPSNVVPRNVQLQQIPNMTARPNVQLQQIPVTSTPSNTLPQFSQPKPPPTFAQTPSAQQQFSQPKPPSTFAQTSSAQQQFKSPVTPHQSSTTQFQMTSPNARSYSSSNPPYKPVHPSQYATKSSIQDLPRTSNSSLPNWTSPNQSVQQPFYNQSPSFSHNFTPQKPQQFSNVSYQQSPINLQRSQPPANLTPSRPTTQQPGPAPRMSALSQETTVGEMINQYRNTYGYNKSFPMSIQEFLAIQQRMPNNNAQSNQK